MNNIWDTVNLFESHISEFCGSKYAVATDSCTNSIFLCIKYNQYIGKIVDTLVVPNKTYVSVPMACKNAGVNVVFKDIQWEGSYKIEPYNIIDSACKIEKNMYEKDTLTCLSFHFKKLIPIGRGGMILTDDHFAYEWLLKARYDGREGYSYNLINNDNMNFIGYHMYMIPEMASRGIEQFFRYKEMYDSIPHTCGKSENYRLDLSTLNVFK